MVFSENALLGLGLMLSAGEVPRIAGTFGLDTTTTVSYTHLDVYKRQALVGVGTGAALFMKRRHETTEEESE